MNRLGTEGHSGDETDHIPYQLRYAVKKLPWRSPKLTEFLRTLDLLHLSTQFTKSGKLMKGGLPRLRIRSEQMVDKDCSPVPGLPRSFYDEEWLAMQDEHELKALQITSDDVDLKIPQTAYE